MQNDIVLSTYDSSNWADLKKKLPAYFWPQVLMENLIAIANKKQQAKIDTVLKQMKKMEEKDPLYKRIDKIMAEYHRNVNQKKRLAENKSKNKSKNTKQSVNNTKSKKD